MSLLRPSPLAVNAGQLSGGEFSQDERTTLLRLAHDSILSLLEEREIPLDPPTAHLAEPRGAFTSLYLSGQLRGCVGYVLPVSPVYRAVADTARAAAFEDIRFRPVTLPEAPHLEIELSILSQPQPIPAEAIEIGRHGLLISRAGRRGLLLPQVPSEHHWTARLSSNKPAAKPACLWTHGKTARPLRLSPPKFSEKSTRRIDRPAS